MWPSLCTIQSFTYTANAANQLIQTGTVNVNVGIPCILVPDKNTASYDEKRAAGLISQFKGAKCKLNAYLPNLDIRIYQAVVDGVVFQIRGVDADALDFSTELRLEIVNGGSAVAPANLKVVNLSSQMPSATVTLPDVPAGGGFFQLFRNGLLEPSGYSLLGAVVTLTPPGQAGETIEAVYFGT